MILSRPITTTTTLTLTATLCAVGMNACDRAYDHETMMEWAGDSDFASCDDAEAPGDASGCELESSNGGSIESSELLDWASDDTAIASPVEPFADAIGEGPDSFAPETIDAPTEFIDGQRSDTTMDTPVDLLEDAANDASAHDTPFDADSIAPTDNLDYADGVAATAAKTNTFYNIGISAGSKRYATMTVTDTDHGWGCGSVSAVVQFRLKNVDVTGFTFDGIRVFDGSGNGAHIAKFSHGKGSFTTNTTASKFSWSSWLNLMSNGVRLSWASRNINVSVQVPGQPWYCSRSRTFAPYLK